MVVLVNVLEIISLFIQNRTHTYSKPSVCKVQLVELKYASLLFLFCEKFLVSFQEQRGR